MESMARASKSSSLGYLGEAVLPSHLHSPCVPIDAPALRCLFLPPQHSVACKVALLYSDVLRLSIGAPHHQATRSSSTISEFAGGAERS